MKLNNLHQQRWNAAVKLLTNIKVKHKNKPDVLLLYNGDLITREQIVITEDSIFVKIDNLAYDVFLADPQQDCGLYKSTKDFKQEVKEQFKLVKILKY